MKLLSQKKFLPFYFFRKNQKFSSFLSLFLTLSFLNLIISCSYYKVRDLTTSPETMARQIDELNESQKYVVIHSGGTIWHLENLVLSEENKTISGIAQEIDKYHIPFQPREKKKVHRYNNKQTPLNEIHFFVNNNNIPDFGTEVSIPFSEIYTISVNDKNNGRTAANIAVGTIGVIAVIGIIAALTKSSCPFIYINNGEEFVFTGELYPGILTANQQRNDYLLLPNLNEVNNEYSIKITNELKEIQYTDYVQLLEVNHPDNVKVLLDKNGKLHTFSNIISPNNVLVDHLNTNSDPVLVKDNNSYLFNSELISSSSLRNIELKFNKPQQTKNAKLVLTVKNSMWLDYVFGKFNEQFGSYYSQFQKDQQDFSKEKSTKWMNEQSIPLSVYLKTNTGWELVDRINTVGPMASRDIAVPIDISNAPGEEVFIKLETGFMFWEVDYVGIDFTENLALDINYINPNAAIDGNNNNVTKLLLGEDQNYLVQPNIGDEVIVTFKTSKPTPDIIRTVFLKNRGYYNYIRNYEGEPDFQKLRLFKQAGAFTDFSMYEYQALMDYENQFDLASNTK
ncbi:hypothetical protein [uncultured Eudoraea sp.]|uniref:hypothetical protein n=1 Tax=uncultured Eudoraea sp. TaxID=1035614 RepID=UPI0026226707|nr:hypothetical protein [uncultured Eudoraea sp.]